MMRYFKIYLQFLKINITKSIVYRGGFMIFIVLTAFESTTMLLALNVVFGHIHSIAGWSYHEMLILIGTYMMADTFAWLVYKAGLRMLDEIINRGDFDWMLVKPIDPQAIATFNRIDLEDAGRSLVGIAVFVIGLVGAGMPEPGAFLVFAALFVLGQIVLYGITLIIKSISFKSIHGWATNAISFRLQFLTQYPGDIYTGVMRGIYTFIIPIIFVVTVPVKALTGRLTLALLLGAVVAAAGVFAVSRAVWKRALRTYSSASS